MLVIKILMCSIIYVVHRVFKKFMGKSGLRKTAWISNFHSIFQDHLSALIILALKVTGTLPLEPLLLPPTALTGSYNGSGAGTPTLIWGVGVTNAVIRGQCCGRVNEATTFDKHTFP